MVINAELIKTVESLPDTTLTLLDGQRIIVRESQDEVVRKAIDYGRMLRKLLAPS